MKGALWIIGLGPGDWALMTELAQERLATAEIVLGYEGYLASIAGRLRRDQDVRPYPITQERLRAEDAVNLAGKGHRVALVSSGDAGIYGMAGLALEILAGQGWTADEGPAVEVVPGVTALAAAAARVGAPLMHDFVAISLSDLLTPWEVIERRIRLAAAGDFVVVFYNPKSHRRVRPLEVAQAILLQERRPTTPVALVRQAFRADENLILTQLDRFLTYPVDMVTTVIIGNSQSFTYGRWMITPRGYPR